MADHRAVGAEGASITSGATGADLEGVALSCGWDFGDDRGRLGDSATFTDPGTADNPWTARVNWGGWPGRSNAGRGHARRPVRGSRTYPTPGTYTALVEVKDRFGAFATRGQITVIVQ